MVAGRTKRAKLKQIKNRETPPFEGQGRGARGGAQMELKINLGENDPGADSECGDYGRF